MGEVIPINFGREINAEGWLYNRSSRLYFISAEIPAVPENVQAILVVDPSFERNFVHCESRSQRYGYWTKPLTGIRVGAMYTRGEYSGYGDVEFDPSTDEYQISAGEWKVTAGGLDFLCILTTMVSTVNRVNYHKDKFLTVPQVSKNILNRLFEKTEELEAQIKKTQEAKEPLLTLLEKYPQLFP